METVPGVAAALLLGLVGSTHCLGMCGGISAALAVGIDARASRARRLAILVAYNLGRISSYALLGALLGLLSSLLLGWYKDAMFALRIAAGVLLILMGLYLAGWSQLLTHLERGGSTLMRPLQRASARLFSGRGIASAIAGGIVWGWLPCGLVYSTLIWAGTSGDWRDGALLMFAFGLGTIPAVLAVGVAGATVGAWLKKSPVRIASGLMVILFGLWTLAQPLLHSGHAGHGAGGATPAGSSEPHRHH
jgi:hypothetical protein